MERIFALIKDNLIVNTIVADDMFFEAMSDAQLGCDSHFEITNLVPRPGIGWSHNGMDFIPPEE